MARKLSIIIPLAVMIGLFVLLGSSKDASPTNTVTTVLAPVANTSPQPSLQINGLVQAQKYNITHLSLDSSQIVEIVGPIGQTTDGVADKINELGHGKKPVWVLIDSPGGSVLEGAMIVSSIESSQAPVYTVCLRLCASMAAIIHQYGKQRYMVNRSILMFHDASGALEGSVPQMRSRLNWIEGYTNEMDAFVANRTHQTLPEFLAKLGNELWLPALDALKGHYADNLVSVSVKKDKPTSFGLSTSKELIINGNKIEVEGN